MEWQPSGTPGVAIKELYADSGHSERVALTKWEPDARYPWHSHPCGEEILVLEGSVVDEAGRYPRGTWIRNPPDSAHAPFSREGCVLLIKTGGVR
jgi:anti-sigma factor ChrR (cupin superfamily)